MRRPGVEEPLTIIVKPDRSRGAFLIGVTSRRRPRGCWRIGRHGWCRNAHAVLPGSAADLAEPAFRNGDKIVQIDDAPIENYAQINAELARKADRKITVTVERAVDRRRRQSRRARRDGVSIAVGSQPHAHLGAGDGDGRDHGRAGGFARRRRRNQARRHDLQDRRQRRGRSDDAARPAAPPRRQDRRIDHPTARRSKTADGRAGAAARSRSGFRSLEIYDSPVDVAALGIAYRVLNRVDSVIEGSPAAKAGLLPEDVIVKAKLIPPDKEILRELGRRPVGSIASRSRENGTQLAVR